MGQVIQVNGDYTIKARRTGGGSITLDTGDNTGSVTITGDLNVLGTTHSISTSVIEDVVLILNRGESSAGVSYVDSRNRSGIEIDRGSEYNAELLFDETIHAWTISEKESDAVSHFTNSRLKLKEIWTDAVEDGGDLTLIGSGVGLVKVDGTADYEQRIIDSAKLASVAISSISRSANRITITTQSNHGIVEGQYVDVQCFTLPTLSALDYQVMLRPSATTIVLNSTGFDFDETHVVGYLTKRSWYSDDHIPNMKAVVDYSRTLVKNALGQLSVSSIADQDTSVSVYDSETGGGESNIKFTVDGVECARFNDLGQFGIGTNDPLYGLDVVSDGARIQNANNDVSLLIGSQTNSGYIFGTATEISLISDTTSGYVTLSKVSGSQYLKLNAGTGNSKIELYTAGIKRATIDGSGKVFINETTGDSQFNLSTDNTFGGAGYAGLVTLKNTVLDSVLPKKHIRIAYNGDFELTNNANTTAILKIADDGTVTLVGGLTVVDYIATPSTSFDLINTNAATVNFAGAGTAISIGASIGVTTINNPELAVGSGSSSSITTPSASFDLINTNAATVNFAGVGTAISIGASTGLTTIHNPELAVGSGSNSSITTPSASFDLINTNAATINFAGVGTAISIGANTGLTTIHNPELAVGSGSSSAITTPSTTFDLVNGTATTVNFAGAGTAISIGASTGLTTVNHNLAVNGGTLSTTASTFNLINTNATTVNFAGAGTAISIGASTGVTTINNPELSVGSGSSSSITTPSTSFNLINTNATTVNFARGASTIHIGSDLPGTTTIHHDLVVSGTIVYGGDANTLSATNLQVTDAMIYMADGNIADSVDIGLVAAHNYDAVNPYPHTGFIRDATDKVWKLFDNLHVEPEGQTVIDFSDPLLTYSDLKIGNLFASSGTFTGNISAVNGVFSGDVSATNATFSGTVSGSTGSFTSVNATNATITGTLTGADATFSGTVSGNSGSFGTLAVDTIVSTAPGGLNADTVTNGVYTTSKLSSLAATTSAELASVITDKTGTELLVFNNTPTLVTPILGAATATSINKVTITQPASSATLTIADGSSLVTSGAYSITLTASQTTNAQLPSGSYTVGYLNIPQTIATVSKTTTLADSGGHVLYTGSAPATYTIDQAVNYDIGTVLTVVNDTNSGDLTIQISTGTLVQAGTGLTGTRVLSADGIATIMKISSSKWIINGSGLT